MKIGKYSKAPNVWQRVFLVSWRRPWDLHFSPYVELAYFKLIRPVQDGEPISRKDYRGILWQWSLPILRPYRYFVTRPLYTYFGLKDGEQVPRWAIPLLSIQFVRKILRRSYAIPVEFRFS